MTEPSGDEVERLYQYLVEHITAKKYPPSRAEIIQVMGWSTSKVGFGERNRRVYAALEALQQAGKIRVLKTIQGRRDIRLTTLPSQSPTPSIATPAANTAPRRELTPGPLPCIECGNHVCEESNSRCTRHFQINRESGKRLRMRRRLDQLCAHCRNPLCAESTWFCALHLRLNREASRRYEMRKRERKRLGRLKEAYEKARKAVA
jgi:hypothetical protein